MPSGLISMRTIVVMSFNKDENVEQVRQLSVNVANKTCPIERAAVKRAAAALLDDDKATSLCIVMGKKNSGEFSDAKKAGEWAVRELFEDEA